MRLPDTQAVRRELRSTRSRFSTRCQPSTRLDPHMTSLRKSGFTAGGSHVRVEALVNPVALAEEVHLANPKPSPASRRFAIGTIEAL